MVIDGGVFGRRIKEQEQSEFWVVASKLPKATPSRFYELVNRTLEEMKFREKVWELCRPAYADESKGGRPGIDSVVGHGCSLGSGCFVTSRPTMTRFLFAELSGHYPMSPVSKVTL